MDVSVIFATYNREDVIKDVLDKWREVSKVTKYSFEIICSDDASTDKTPEIIREAEDLPIKFLKNEKGGAGQARNAALQIALGRLVIFTGDDMFPDADFVNQHYENYLKYGDKVATLGKILWHHDIKLNHLMHHITDVGCEQFGFIGLPPYQFIDFRHFYTSNISVSKKLLDSLSVCFRTDFDKYGFEDVELGYRLQKAGMKIYYDPSIVVEHFHIYDSVEKFCIRQETAGEELVVFNEMHDDLKDKCICDIDNCRRALNQFISARRYERSIKGIILYAFIYISRKSTYSLEKIISKRSYGWSKSICSLLYAGLFQFYFFFGCTTRLTQDVQVSRSLKSLFTYEYLKKGFAQLYWDTGYDFNENESRKWVIWDTGSIVIEETLPENVHQIRFSPMKNPCQAWISQIYFILKTGEKTAVHPTWTNSQSKSKYKFDFTCVTDPQIVISDLPLGYHKIVIEMSVRDMKKRRVLAAVRRSAGKIYHKWKAHNNANKDIDIKFVNGQPRMVQIVIKADNDKMSEDLANGYARQLQIFNNAVIVSDTAHIQRGYTNYIYNPDCVPIDKMQFMQAVLVLLHTPLDYIVVSDSYEDLPAIGGTSLNDQIIYSEILVGAHLNDKLSHAIGKVMRLPSFNRNIKTLQISQIIDYSSARDGYYFNIAEKELPFLISNREYTFQKKKPVVFVLPIFLAVGGVERNTIETMRSLKEYYDFCVITMERHNSRQGSLHYQLEGLCDYCFDLREITHADNYLNTLYILKQMFRPDIVWLCNNMPWLEEHFGLFRKLFHDTKIVMQDVYDTEVGWIEYYESEEIQKSDKFIAITELIKDTFINKYHIPEYKINVIYPVVDQERILAEKSQTGISFSQICHIYGLDPHKKHFATVGRITAQKNPIRYLTMIQDLKGKHTDIEFIMVGEGQMSNDVDTFISKHKMYNEVKRVHYISNALEFIKILDGLIILSDYEGMPIVSIEAMSLGVPVMSTDVGDIKRFMNRTGGGMIVDKSKSDGANFEYFLSQLDSFRSNARNNADNILHFFSADNQSKEYVKCFSD